MEEEILRYREAKLMEPIYRMYKVISEKDELKAQTFMAVVVQYVTEQYKDVRITPADVQNLIRAVLLHDDDGIYYSMYAYNEIQVKTAEWITILAADLPITLDDLGNMANQIAEGLKGQVIVNFSPEDVVGLMEKVASEFDVTLLGRIQLNREIYTRELGSFLVSGNVRH